jgi:hypothetical protein
MAEVGALNAWGRGVEARCKELDSHGAWREQGYIFDKYKTPKKKKKNVYKPQSHPKKTNKKKKKKKVLHTD